MACAISVSAVIGCSDVPAEATQGQDYLDIVGENESALIHGTAFAMRSIAFVFVDLGGGVNLTPAAAMGKLVTNPSSLRNYYLYNSYGRQDITAQTFGPFSASLLSCDVSSLAASLRPQVPGTFQHYFWYLGSRQQACGWSSLAAIGNPSGPAMDSWYNASSTCLDLMHDLGHNLGEQHSASLRCTGSTLANDPNQCTVNDFGDLFDVMGSACRHMNAWHKAHLGWLGGCNGVSITATGTFTLLPAEQRCDGAQFLNIRAPVPRTLTVNGVSQTLDRYYVELRTPLDFDGTVGNTSGLLPRVVLHLGSAVSGPGNSGLRTYLLDLTPNTSTFSDSTFAVGQTFTDPAGGLSITLDALSAQSATVRVQVTGGSGSPLCLDGTVFTPPGPGSGSCVDNPPTPVGP